MIEFYDLNELMDQEMQDFAIKVIEDALKILTLPVPVDVCLNIASEEEIRDLNQQQREINRVTDVLSFPMLFFNEPMDNEAFLQEETMSTNPETGNLFLGDIVLCYFRAKQQAEEYGHSLKREVAFLIVHSLLHLLGYDHMTEIEEKEMFQRQEEILNKMGITRSFE